MITKIAAKGPMVNIISDEVPDGQLIARREALKRAKAIIGMDKHSEWLIEQLIAAANQAKINDPDDGQPYPSESMELFLKTAKVEADKTPA